MDPEQTGQTPAVEPTTVTPGQGENQGTVEAPSGSEAHTNSGENEPKLIPIPAEKWRETNQQIRTLKEQLEAFQQPPVPISGEPTVPESGFTDAQTALQAIAQAVKSELSGVLAPLEQMSQEKALTEVGNRPYAQDLAPEIGKEFAQLPAHMAYGEKLDLAYKNALAANIGRIAEGLQKSGYDAAYGKIAEKQSATPSTTNSQAKPVSGEFTPDQIHNMSDAEYNQHRDTILREAGIIR